MHGAYSVFVRMVMVSVALILSGCAAYGGSKLEPGVATRSEVIAALGEPALRWHDADGGEQLAYPRGPAGTQTFMLFLGADGRLQRIEGVLDMAHFARIEPGKSDQAAVLRLLGPSQAHWTVYFEARDELVWEWRFCDDWNKQSFFDVLFDASSGVVRSTFQRRELLGPDGISPFCGH